MSSNSYRVAGYSYPVLSFLPSLVQAHAVEGPLWQKA